MSKISCYLIECRSNLHAGSGNESYGVIDKAVQRDVASQLPIIHGSGLKGALREQFTGSDDDKTIIFGNDPKETDAEKKGAGKYNFYDAWLLSYPVRSNVRPFFSATSPELIQEFLDRCSDFGFALQSSLKALLEKLINLPQQHLSPIIFQQIDYGSDIILEDWIAENRAEEFSQKDLKELSGLFGANLAVLPYLQFQELTKGLPVIARNYLENGQSANLWYEEVVPRGARFYTFIEAKNSHHPYDASGRKQVGGNATVGQGQVLISELKSQRDEKNN